MGALRSNDIPVKTCEYQVLVLVNGTVAWPTYFFVFACKIIHISSRAFCVQAGYAMLIRVQAKQAWEM